MVRLYKTVKSLLRSRRESGAPKAPASLQNLPLELFYAIVEVLPSEADKQCVRITCRAFKELIKRDPRLPSDSLKDYDIEFAQRLLREGNILHDPPGDKLCFDCFNIRDKTKFPVPSLRVIGGPICVYCIAGSVRQRWNVTDSVTQGGEELYVCKTCKYGFYENRTCKEEGHNARRSELREHERICVYCCKTCKVCPLRSSG